MNKLLLVLIIMFNPLPLSRSLTAMVEYIKTDDVVSTALCVLPIFPLANEIPRELMRSKVAKSHRDSVEFYMAPIREHIHACTALIRSAITETQRCVFVVTSYKSDMSSVQLICLPFPATLQSTDPQSNGCDQSTDWTG